MPKKNPEKKLVEKPTKKPGGKLAPIVLFVYNRPWHTRQTVESLQKNELAKESDIFIYADNANSEKVLPQVKKVRDYIKTIDGFKNITIIERDKNWGLADSIIDGVTTVVNQYEHIIVLEDDLVTSSYFLKFMNEALDFYRNEDKVWHISGWNYPIKTDDLGDVFLWRMMDCWGWATWADKWQYFEKNAEKIINEFTENDIEKFNLDGVSDDFFGQVMDNKAHKINTWGIFWYATIFKRNGLCVSPTHTFVENIGHDDSGVHCDTTDIFSSINLSLNKHIKFVVEIAENSVALNRVKLFFRPKNNLPQKNHKYLIIKTNALVRRMIKMVLPYGFVRLIQKYRKDKKM